MDKVVLLLSLTFWHECRGEGEHGIRGVASVVWNRSAPAKGKYDLSWTVLRPRQFSCWNGRDTRGLTEPVCDNDADRQAWAMCVKIAEEMVDKTFKPIDNYTHYYNPDRCTPFWKDDLTNVKRIGSHVFGKEV